MSSSLTMTERSVPRTLLSAAPKKTLRPASPQGTPDTPVLRMDTDVVAERYRVLQDALPDVKLYYAVKANPARPVLDTLRRLGSRWDVASPGEIDAVLSAGGDPADISYGNTIKKSADIRYAWRRGVRRFVLDCRAELDKLIRSAPGATLLVRLETSGLGADWALSRKFGCTEGDAAELLIRAHRAGHPVGVSFHVGTQQRDPQAWDAPLAATARLRHVLRAHESDLTVVNLGGGFPAGLAGATPDVVAYREAIGRAISCHLGPTPPALMAEPGRALVADAGAVDTSVVLVAERAGERWVYLDLGVFGGLVEPQCGIRYLVTVWRNGVRSAGPEEPTILAGPTCDSLDVLGEPYCLPVDLKEGDTVRFHAAGAYVSSYATVGFNGFRPLREEYR